MSTFASQLDAFDFKACQLLARSINPGRVLYVSSGSGSATASGRQLAKPITTAALATALCTAAKGDIVAFLPGHAETITGAAGITFNKSGVTYRGLGNGRNRATFTFSTSTAAQVLVTAANVRFENIVFDFTGIDAIVAAILVDAADVSFDNCEFITNSGTTGVVSGITVGSTTTSPRFSITNSRFIGPATNSGTTTTAQVTITDAPDFVFENNYCTGKMTQSINNAATNLRGLIRNSAFVVATGTRGVNMAAASTPFITNNRFNVASGTAPIVAAAGFVAGNVYSAAAGVTAGTASTI
jgi:hypothetical protein